MSTVEAVTSTTDPSRVQAEIRIEKANQSAPHFIFGAQRLLLEELVFAGNAMFERAQTETHLLSELASKIAGAHSVNDIRTMYEECSKHQMEFARRDCDRLFRHGERMIQATSNLFKNHRLD
jgi:hypothetical protein